MGKKILFGMILTLLTGCATSHQPGAAELAVRETEQARGTRQALAIVAKATSDALALEEQAERQEANARATSLALTIEATRQVYHLQQTQQAGDATSTAMVIEITRNAERSRGTATAEAQSATTTMQTLNAQATAVYATAEAVQRQNEREQATATLTTFGRYVLMVGAFATAGGVAWYLLPVLRRRATVIRRRADEGEPLVMMERGPDGQERIGLPLREFYSLFTGQRPPDQWQDRATGRQQFTNALLAREAGKIAQAHSGNPTRTVIARSPRISAPMPGNEQWAVHTPAWPTRIPLTGLLNGAPSTWRNLALGVTVHEDGRSEVIRVDMARLVHIAVGGSSGWGKSVFLQSLAYQLAQSKDAIDLTLIDLEGVTFAPFAECERLLYPTADTEIGALAILSALTEEMNRRKSLYADCPGVANLEQYNARASEPISPVVAIFDEATALLDNSGVESAIKTLVLRARKYGLWLVLGGQDWKASSLSTTIRNQLSTRIQFRALSKSQSRVLLQRSGAEALDVPGRALAIIPGRDVVKFQAPIISYETIQATVSGDGPRLAMPETLGQIESSKQSDQILNLKADGASDTRIAREVFGYGNSFYIEKVRGVLRQQQQPATV